MALSLHQATVPLFLQILPNVIVNLDKTEAYTRENGLSDSAVLGDRLKDDIYTLAAHFRMVAMHSADALRSVATGVFSPHMDEAPQDFATLRAMLTDAVSFVQAFDAAQLNALEDREVTFSQGGAVRVRFVAHGFLLSLSLPNLYFHASMAYAMLRNLGIPVTKLEFLGAVQVKQPG
jgi:hypothetical protein